MPVSFIRALLAILICSPFLPAQKLSDFEFPRPLPRGSTLVIGFLGGFENWNDDHRRVRQLALRLGGRPGVCALSIANRNRRVAMDAIQEAFDANQDGKLDPAERTSARIVLYGQSLGGSAALTTARDLENLNIPVLLTVQVDSVGLHDDTVPRNVLAAANFYQHDLFTIWGRRKIHAEDPRRTRVLGNYEYSYPLHPIEHDADASWPRRVLGGSHAKMELDPSVWTRVERYILDAIARN